MRPSIPCERTSPSHDRATRRHPLSQPRNKGIGNFRSEIIPKKHTSQNKNTIMKTHGKLFIMSFMAATIGAAAYSQAAVISVADYTLVPDSTNYGDSNANTVLQDQRTDINTANGGTIVKSTDPVAFYVTTFSFGTSTSADIYLNFTASAGQDRLGIKATVGGIFTVHGGGGSAQTFNIGSGLAGQTVTIIGKFLFDATHSDTYGRNNASDDTIATFWINPTVSDTEGSGLPDGYLKQNGSGTVPNANFTGDVAGQPWNSSEYFLLRQRIDNNFTPGTAGNTSILNTKVLTGPDATFANALTLATIPEPSAALLGGLGMLALLRRRRA